MADVGSKNAADRREPNRLKRRAPASIQISPVAEWNVAIPLLSPLVLSPASDFNPTVEVKSGSDKEYAAEKPPTAAMKKWQHPAAPFGYDAAPVRPFACNR